MSPTNPDKQRRPTFLFAFVFLSLICAIFYGRYHHADAPQNTALNEDSNHEVDLPDPFDTYANVSHLVARDDYSCTKDQTCKTKACCGGFFGGEKGTCGFGPNFCGKDCASNCNAKSECGANADPPGQTCPLNVCCSEFGFCGTATDFCGKGCQSSCGKVKVPAGKAEGGVLKKVIGYYEAWSARWTCHTFPPSALPVDGLTHVNFAFAGIDPGSFKITTMDPKTPESLFMDTADVRTLKSGNLDLKVFASIGGWTFSDNDTKTQPVFGNIAKDEGNRQMFANNVVSFMKEYGFDGVDIDWEYPGAPDRGGHKDDTKNYVALMKTMKDTFDKEAKGKYGLTFTVPTSYWYLRWFDLPGMLKHADWVNVMSYDLHGAWDKDNPIGSIVQGHTNLTEIKLAMELLWRNDVQPGQVVLGFGFYGRAFQLDDVGCSKVGCKFKDAASPGPCTNGAGTLGYFEIQDIIKDQKPDIIHDVEAAVNYFTYTHKDAKRKRSDNGNEHDKRADDKDQWVSFDDKTTMKQKVDWANDLGLGGSMVWSVDQDDDNFSALEGLTGRKLDDFNDELKKSQVTDTGHWSSLNGQQCKLSECGKGDIKCDPGFAIAPGGTKIKDNCGGAGDRIVCCPVDSMPTTCQWRGGETGRACHGQCHTGESFQAFCCEATSFTALIAACKWTGCLYPSFGVPNKDKSSTTCGSDTTKVASKIDPLNCQPGSHIYNSKVDFNKDLCCPKDSAFKYCHWVGQNTCDDNECSATDVQVDRDPFGQGSRCAGGANDREKSLCCNTPKNLNPFLPASLDKLFPTTPPLEDSPKYDLSIIGAGSVGGNGGAGGTDGDANHKAFGFLVLDGPSGAVQSLRKRDGSHWHIVSCEPLQESGATLQIVCMRNDLESNCQDIHEGGVEGTVVALPEHCGPGSYAVVHSIQPSLSQELPTHVKRAAPPESIVYDIELSYDFSLVKRDAGDIFIRLDYSNMNGYWEKVVQADAIKKRSLDKRFWSKDIKDWKAIINGEGSKLGVRNTGIATPSMLIPDVNALLIGAGKNDKCKSDSDDGFLSVKVTGKVDVRMRFGFTFVGTISPNFHLEEAYGFFDSSVEHDGTLEFDGRGKLSMHDETFKQKSILPSPLTAYGYSHPGIVSLGPELDIQATVIGEGEIDGKFSAWFTAGNGDTFTTYNQPKELGDFMGGPGNNLPEDPFVGLVTTKVTPGKPPRKAKRAAGDSTPFAMSLFYKSMMRIDINQYGLKLDNANITFNQYVDSYLRLQGGGNDGEVKVTSSNQEAAYDFESTGELPGWGQSTDTILIGQKGTVYSLYDDNKAPAKRDAPKIDGTPIFDSTHAVSCSAEEKLKCVLLSKLSHYDSTLKNDPETGKPYAEDEPPNRIVKRAGSRRAFTVTTNTGTFTMRSPTYPAGENGAALMRDNPLAGHYGAEDPFDCENTEVTDDYQGADTEAQYVTEHVLELNYFPAFVQFAITGRERLPDGTTYHTPYTTVDENVLNPQSDFWRPYRVWDHTLGDEHPGSPVDRIWQLFGSRINPYNLVNSEMSLNSVKARVWAGEQPMADGLWNENEFNRAGAQPEDITRAGVALSFIRTVEMVFSYLNYQTINNHLGDSTTDMLHELETFSDRHNAVHGTNIDLGALHRDYLNEVLVPRLEGVQAWLSRRLTQLQVLWENQNRLTPGNGSIEDLLELLGAQLRVVDRLRLNSSRMPR